MSAEAEVGDRRLVLGAGWTCALGQDRIVRCFGPELGLPEFELLEENQLAAQRLRVMARLG